MRDNGRMDTPRAREWIDQCETLITRGDTASLSGAAGTGRRCSCCTDFPPGLTTTRLSPTDLACDHDVVTLDFLGYGASDKPNPYQYSVAESADVVEDLVAHLHLDSVQLVAHDYGGIVGSRAHRSNPGR